MKIAVLAGGISTERDVSLSTGRMVYRALRERGHQAVLMDVFLGLEGESAEPDAIFERQKDWSENIGGIGETHPDTEAVRALREDSSGELFGPRVLDVCRRADIVFLGLHGSSGEDGRIQAAFDLLGIRYTGCGHVSSALAMDKRLSRILFAEAGIPVAKGTTVRKGTQEAEKGSGVGYPCIVKPCCGGSSVGVSIARDDAEYAAALALAFSFEETVVVEQFIEGREFSVGVLDGEALPVIEIAPLQGFYDYKNKYQAGSTVETCPARIPDALARAMQTFAGEAYRALGMEAYTRIDFLTNREGEVFCLEANTLPGMTPTSLLPQEAAAVGMNFGELCEKLIRVSLKKYETDGGRR